MKSNWPTKELQDLAFQSVAAFMSDKAMARRPSDMAEYGFPGANQLFEFYSELLGALCKYEGNYKTDSTFKESFTDSKGLPVISRGLLQLSIESCNGYGAKLKNPLELHDPATNLRCAVLILSRWIERDGVIAGGSKGAWRGMARYWSPFRKPDRVAAIKKAMKQVFDQPKGESEMARNIEKELVAYIDKKLEKNGLAQLAIKNKDARALMVQAASALVGIREATGRNDGKMVRLIQETVGGASNEAWCMSTVQTVVAYAEVKTGKKSGIYADELCLTVWNKTPKSHRVKILPLAGAIAIWNDIGKTSGHTEMVLSSDGKTFTAIGGNTGGTTKPGQPVEANGNGVYYTVRSTAATKKRKILGYLIPFEKIKA